MPKISNFQSHLSSILLNSGTDAATYYYIFKLFG